MEASATTATTAGAIYIDNDVEFDAKNDVFSTEK